MNEYIVANNIIIGYFNGKAIVQNEWGQLFYYEMPEEFAEPGTVVATKYLTDIEQLDKEELEYIIGELNGNI